MASLFALLNDDVIKYALSFVNLKGIASLDDACSRYDRADFLAMVRGMVVENASNKAVYGLVKCIYWLHSRNIQTSKLHLNLSALNRAHPFAPLPTVTVRELYLHNRCDASHIVPFFSSFVGVEKLDFRLWMFIDSEQMSEFKTFRWPLKAIVISYSDMLDPDVVGASFHGMCQNLEEFRCNRGVDDKALSALSKNWTKLRRFDMSIQDVSFPVIQHILANNANTLEVIEMACYDHTKAALIYEHIVQYKCTQLTSICIGYHRTELDISTLRNVLKLCPKIKSLDWCGTLFKFDFSDTGERMEVDVDWGHAHLPDIKEVCSVLDVPIVGCCFMRGMEVYVDSELLLFIAETFGQDLWSLRCPMWESEEDTIDDTTFIRVLSLCPNLSQLYIRNCSLLTRKSLLQLPILCPYISSLSLEAHTALTDEDVVCLLEASEGNEFSLLSFNECTQLTEITVRKTSKLFPEAELCMEDTAAAMSRWLNS